MDVSHVQTVLANGTKHEIGDCWLMLEGNFEFNCVLLRLLRPDTVLYSECERIVYLIELTIHFEDAIEEAFERKKLRNAELMGMRERKRCWQAHTRPVEIDVRGFVATNQPQRFC